MLMLKWARCRGRACGALEHLFATCPVDAQEGQVEDADTDEEQRQHDDFGQLTVKWTVVSSGHGHGHVYVHVYVYVYVHVHDDCGHAHVTVGRFPTKKTRPIPEDGMTQQ
jgi:hypothetical protein